MDPPFKLRILSFFLEFARCTCKKKKLRGIKQLTALYFTNEGLRLHYANKGEGSPVLLVHGFASNMKVNWFDTGWVDFLTGHGRRVVAFDHRGHGLSDKPHDPKLYEPSKMAGDALALLDYLDIKRAAVMGYSMGARVAAFMALHAPQRLCSLILGGIGTGLHKGIADPQIIVDALQAPRLADVATQKGRMFRAFAEQTKGDLKALAACISAERRNVIKGELAKISIPVLIAAGTADDIAHDPHELAKLIPAARVLDITGRDHMRAVGDRQYKEGVISFWNSLPPCHG
jgi:pimeloyl-ACP methyl ester carboxylesterase